MKPYEELTYLGRVRRMRQLAEVALSAYGLSEARFRLVVEAGNTLFRVSASGPASAETASELFEKGQYLLRIHHPRYQSRDEIELELAWLAAMRREADLPVPEPFPTPDGRLLVQASIAGIPQERNCSLLRWMKGRFATGRIQSHHFRAQGQLMARLHGFAARWEPPSGCAKRQYDWEGLFRDDSGAGLRATEAWRLLPPSWVEPFESVAHHVRRVMDELGKGPEVYGLIHADLGVDANVLFWNREARAIDFDDSGFGYWVYDLAVSLEHCREDAAFPRYRDALLDGYTRIRPLPAEHVERLELFMAAFDVYWSLWAAAVVHLHPERRQSLRMRMGRAVRLVQNYVARC